MQSMLKENIFFLKANKKNSKFWVKFKADLTISKKFDFRPKLHDMTHTCWHHGLLLTTRFDMVHFRASIVGPEVGTGARKHFPIRCDPRL